MADEPSGSGTKKEYTEMSKARLCFKLFTSALFISAFTFGGGYVIISLFKKKYVDELGWLDEAEMLNMAALAQSSPGAVAVNAAILLGFKIAGIAGAAVALLGTVLPPLVVISVISAFYSAFRTNPVVSAVLKGMQAGVAAVIADVVINLGKNVVKSKDAVSYIIMLAAFVATFFFGVNVVYIIIAAGALGGFSVLIKEKRQKKTSPKGGEAK